MGGRAPPHQRRVALGDEGRAAAQNGSSIPNGKIALMSEARRAWERANKAWMEEYFVLIQATFASFWEKGEWPEERALTRKFAQSSGPRIDVARAVQAQPPGLGLAARVTFRHVSLGVRHLLGVPEARQMLNLLVAIGSRAAEIYKTTEDETRL